MARSMHRSFGSIPSLAAQQMAAEDKIRRTASVYPFHLESIVDVRPKMSSKSVVVVGAGFAGLTAAGWHSRQGFQVKGIHRA